MMGNFEAIARYKIGVTALPINNGGYSGYGQGFCGPGHDPYTWKVSDHDQACMANMAKAVGFHAEDVRQPSEIIPALKRALDENAKGRPRSSSSSARITRSTGAGCGREPPATESFQSMLGGQPGDRRDAVTVPPAGRRPYAKSSRSRFFRVRPRSHPACRHSAENTQRNLWIGDRLVESWFGLTWPSAPGNASRFFRTKNLSPPAPCIRSRSRRSRPAACRSSGSSR